MFPYVSLPQGNVKSLRFFYQKAFFGLDPDGGYRGPSGFCLSQIIIIIGVGRGLSQKTEYHFGLSQKTEYHGMSELLC